MKVRAARYSFHTIYDNNGNLLTTTDAKNVTTTNTYDALNRVQTRAYSDSITPTVTYTYDDTNVPYSKGQLTKVSSSISEARYTSFDQAGRLVTSEQATNGKVYPSSYKYNLSGIMTEQTYPSGRVVKNFLESDGDLSAIVSKVQNGQFENYASNFSYTASKVIKHLQLGNGLWESAKLNSRHQVTELNMGNSPTDGSLWQLKYDYGELDTNGNVDATKNSGNIARQTIGFSGLANPFMQTYKYDSLDRIKEAEEKNNGSQMWKQTWDYDSYGNRTGFSQVVHGQQLAINSQTLPAVDANTNRFQTGQGYGYDSGGNLISDAEGRQFTFDGDNKQIEVKNASNVLVGKYFYDGNGKRVKKIEYDSNGVEKWQTIFVYDGTGKLVAEYSSEPPVSNPTVNYTATDPLGSPRVITNKQGEIVSRRDFMPFGEQVMPDATYRKTNLKYNYGDNIRQKFTGYQRDEETQLDFAEARYYNNKHGRFTAVDPLLASGKSADPQTFNRYAYTMNRPLILTDSTGLQAGEIVASKKSGREQEFINKHGLITASRIGEGKITESNIAGATVRFTNNSAFSKVTPLNNEDGSERNAFRHAMLAATITKDLGENIARDATNSHEKSDSVDLNQLPTKDKDLVDQAVDLYNNARGIEIGRGAIEQGLDTKQTAIAVLDYFKNVGLTTAIKNPDGTLTYKVTRISQETYDSTLKEWSPRNTEGYSPEYLEAERKRKFDQNYRSTGGKYQE